MGDGGRGEEVGQELVFNLSIDVEFLKSKVRAEISKCVNETY